MDGCGIFDFAMRRVPEDIKRCLQINSLTMADIDYVVFHQISRYIMEWLDKRLSAPPEKIFRLGGAGNTVSY